jgi:hypothetical protein
MAQTFISGTDGGVTVGSSGGSGENKHSIQFNTWSATVNRTVHDVTKYGDTGRRRVLGLLDVTGSAGGFASHSASHLALDAGAGMQAAGQAFDDLVLTFFTGCTWTFHAVIDSMAATSTMGGDTTVTMNFQLADGAGLTEAWDES